MVFKDKTVKHHSNSFSNSGLSTVTPEILPAVVTSACDPLADRLGKARLAPEEITNTEAMGHVSMFVQV